eukprot:CAMPEP_0177409878 /NCGR_PEP_ID=MMETSP0368-20130122/64501_1 /TAXON_ID=447022 ORGANISM="Scrippsiella hangoei-like, Strain SHHI-4" /NCGR_SAMPLE_ID=MMETSP0368 /ASSEMBLY_ACC=CAM_ASM_000363 /LENGTH=295 /DNA_ID=CAMNT_0018878721 /DNA_START=95 /DNA_END=982 /DNA_ORIENTATION=-
MSEKSLTSKENAASSTAGSCSPLPSQPRWPHMLPGCDPVWQSDLSLQILPKAAGEASNSLSVSKAAASASLTVFAAPSLRAIGSTCRSCECLKSTCRKKTEPASPEPKLVVFSLFNMPFPSATRRGEGSAAVAPTRSASLHPLPAVGTLQAALSGSILTMGVGNLKSRAPMALLVDRPTFSKASCLGSASDEPGRRIVSTASLHTALACSNNLFAEASNFSKRLICHLHAFSASSVTESVSVSAVLSTPRSSAAPSRVWMLALSTLQSSLQASASLLKIVSASSFAESNRAKALL